MKTSKRIAEPVAGVRDTTRREAGDEVGPVSRQGSGSGEAGVVPARSGLVSLQRAATAAGSDGGRVSPTRRAFGHVQPGLPQDDAVGIL